MGVGVEVGVDVGAGVGVGVLGCTVGTVGGDTVVVAGDPTVGGVGRGWGAVGGGGVRGGRVVAGGGVTDRVAGGVAWTARRPLSSPPCWTAAVTTPSSSTAEAVTSTPSGVAWSVVVMRSFQVVLSHPQTLGWGFWLPLIVLSMALAVFP